MKHWIIIDKPNVYDPVSLSYWKVHMNGNGSGYGLSKSILEPNRWLTLRWHWKYAYGQQHIPVSQNSSEPKKKKQQYIDKRK